MIDQLIRTELRELDKLRDEIPLLFDIRDGHAYHGFEDLADRYDRGLRRLEQLIAAGWHSPWITDAVLDAIDWFQHLLQWRARLLKAALGAV
jgi:hypothetical protein